MMERIEKMRVSDDALDLVFRKAPPTTHGFPSQYPRSCCGTSTTH